MLRLLANNPLHGSAMTKLKRSRTQLERVALHPQITQILDEFRI